MQSPHFWWQHEQTALARLLSLVGGVYGAIAAKRLQHAPTVVPFPVICVGNFTVGGAGKTPVVASIQNLLMKAGHRPFVLSRGYGGSLKGAVRVDPSIHTAQEVGDEPMLLAGQTHTGCGVIISRDRVKGAQLAIEHGALCIVMDDGLQNPYLHKDIVLSVVDAHVGFGNALCIPAGPLRAPLSAQWPLIDAIVLIGDGIAGASILAQAHEHAKPILRAKLVPDPHQAAYLKSKQLIAFAGIGRPEKFFETLRGVGAVLQSTHAFADHRPYQDAELTILQKQARDRAATLVTTRKDFMRLTPNQKAFLKDDLYTMDVTLEWENPEHIEKLLKTLMDKPTASDLYKI